VQPTGNEAAAGVGVVSNMMLVRVFVMAQKAGTTLGDGKLKTLVPEASKSTVAAALEA